MHPTDIPDKIKPEDEEDGIEVPVRIPSLEWALDDVAAAAKSMGMEYIDPLMVRRMEKAGVALDHLGLMKMSKAGLFLTNQGLMHAGSQLLAAMSRTDDLSEKRQLAKDYGYLAGKIALISRETREAVGITEQAAKLSARVKSFQPCAIVQNNYYNAKPTHANPTPHGQKETEKDASGGLG